MHMYQCMIAQPRPQVVNCSVAIGVAPFAYLLSIILNSYKKYMLAKNTKVHV